MSGLAEYFLEQGFTVSGSDREQSATTERLKRLGITVTIGHGAKNLENAHAVVYSDAIDDENPELKWAKEQKLYLISRVKALAMIAENFGQTVGVCGCHGKTTVTCMLAHIFNSAGLEFTAHIGGEDRVLGGFVSKGSKVFLTEVCEFKKNIDRFTADFAVCVNYGKDHMDCYESEKELQNSYLSFIKRAYKSIINKNDKFLTNYNGKNAVGFSVDGDGEVVAKNLKQRNGAYRFDLYVDGKKKTRIKLFVKGRHNVENAIASCACAIKLGISVRAIKAGLASFRGVVRRFEELGKLGEGVVIADYAHHPTEIESAMRCAQETCKGKIFVVFQPHTYSRTVFLKEQFVSVLSEIENLSIFKTFSAREKYIEGGGADDLCRLIDKATYFDSESQLLAHYKKLLKKGDVLLILGAGDLSSKIAKGLI